MSQDYSDDVFGSTQQVQTNMQQIEANFACLKSSFSGAAAPPDPVAGMWWFDTDANILKLRNEDNNAWLSVWDIANNRPGVELTLAMMAAACSNAAAGTPSLRSIGTTSTTACAGNDARLSDARPANGGTSAACSGNSATATTAANCTGDAATVNGVKLRINGANLECYHLGAWSHVASLS